jgi:hypothetical protein
MITMLCSHNITIQMPLEDPTACSTDMHEPSSKYTPPVSFGTPGELFVRHNLPTSAPELSWTPVPEDKTITGYTVQVEEPQEIPMMDGNATSYELSSANAMTEAGTEPPISVSSITLANGEFVLFT